MLLEIVENWDGSIEVKIGVERLFFRSLCPSDYYQIDYHEYSPLEILGEVLCDRPDLFGELPLYWFMKNLYNYLAEQLIVGRVLTVKSWLQEAFYLQKGRWTSDLDWLEKQPVDKIQIMFEIFEKTYAKSGF